MRLVQSMMNGLHIALLSSIEASDKKMYIRYTWSLCNVNSCQVHNIVHAEVAARGLGFGCTCDICVNACMCFNAHCDCISCRNVQLTQAILALGL